MGQNSKRKCSGYCFDQVDACLKISQLDLRSKPPRDLHSDGRLFGMDWQKRVTAQYARGRAIVIRKIQVLSRPHTHFHRVRSSSLCSVFSPRTIIEKRRRERHTVRNLSIENDRVASVGGLFHFKQTCEVACWQTDKQIKPAFVAYWTNSGHRPSLELNGSAANDPKRTLAVRKPIRGFSHLALRCGINSAYAVITAESKYAE